MNGLYGRAATGLSGDTSWAASTGAANAGAKAERATEKMLAPFSDRAAVMHDLRVPIPGFKSNIDHVIVSGKKVLILDTKSWQPGFYWTLRGINRRGKTRVDHTAKDQSYIHRALTRHLAGTDAFITESTLVIWPSRASAKVSTWLLKVPGARVIAASALPALVRRFIIRKEADATIVAKLFTLLVTPADIKPSASNENHFA